MYGPSRPAQAPLLLLVLVFNYLVGRTLSERHRTDARTPRALLAFGVTANLALLGYFKYWAFIVQNVGALTGADYAVQAIVLPLGISFFTFQMIGHLVDAATGQASEYNFVDYCLFVTFFPQLIAGPIVHHREMMTQFERPVRDRLSAEGFARGITFFTVGLFKKVAVADNLAPVAAAAFTAGAGEGLSAASAWRGALAYTFQLYFDFSGYSDMALGLGLMFGIRLPYNFSSPYKAASIIDFWRRWHVTLSRFLRDYLYVPLGGNKRGSARRYLNLFATMLLGGLWHGAAWTFVIWGALHGCYLVINHGWQALSRGWAVGGTARKAGAVAGHLLTFLAVVVGWVFFRAPSVDAALDILQAMAGLNGLAGAEDPARLALAGDAANGSLKDRIKAASGDLWLLLLWIAGWRLPNTQEIVDGEAEATAQGWLYWRPTPVWAVSVALCLLLTMTQISRVSEFLYFQF